MPLIVQAALIGILLALPFTVAAQSSDQEFGVQLDALVAKHQYARAEQLLQKRLSGGEDPAATYFQAGKVYFDHEEWQRSAEFLKESLKLKGRNDQAHRLLGLDWRELHRPDAAAAELLEAARENPSDRVNAYFAGHQLLLNGKIEAALPYLYSALESKPQRSQALEALALAQARLGNYGLAESYYRKAIDSAQTYSALVNLSVLLLLGHDPKRLEEGLAFARHAEKLQPDSSEAHFLAGKALFKLKRLQEARPELEQGKKLSPDDSKSHFLLAQVYDQLGQHDRARKERDYIARIQRRTGQAGIATADPVPALP